MEKPDHSYKPFRPVGSKKRYNTPVGLSLKKAAGTVSFPGAGMVFVVHRHKASHLHYDLRLEVQGILKSWTIPKGPSMNPADKRLAIMTEDHPFSYRHFEGEIMDGNYGAGIVEIWDQGYLSDPEESGREKAEQQLIQGIRNGHLRFKLRGKKLKGEFSLIKLKGRGNSAWVLIKHDDRYAVDMPYNSEDHTLKNSPINKWLRKHEPEKLPPRHQPLSVRKGGKK